MAKNLNLKEKCSLCTGKDFWHTFGIPDKGIPSLNTSDGPHGLRKQNENADHLGIHDSVKAVCFPSAGCIACSFDREAVFLMGRLLGEAARAEGVHILLGPAMNIKRTPLCGRNFEYYSEDPFLTGELAAQAVKGIQSEGVGACVKHFAANNQENRRMTVSANMSERTLREIYLAAFERAIKAAPAAVMSSYNRLNGEYVGESKRLMEILRGEWGFEGVVISDWYAVCDRARSILAGLDLEMPGGPAASAEKLEKAASESREVMDAVTRSADRIARTARALFREKTDGYDMEKHHDAAVRLACDAAVLLKNEEKIFPIMPGEKVLFVGEYAEKTRFQGGGSSHINAYRADGVTENIAGFDVDYFPWCKSLDSSCMENLRAIGGGYDKIVVFAGLPDEYESEGYDRETVALPKQFDDLISCAAATGAATGVVLLNGSPVAMPWLGDVKGVLEMGLAGEGAGKACAMILTGEVNPSGRLAESYPARIEHTPAYLNSKGLRDVDYSEGVFVGYRYYATKKIPPLFPFGYGLSYTRFSYSSLKVESARGGFNASVRVKNTGARFGKEVVQLYVSPPRGGVIDRPAVELRGFEKVSLEAGEEKTVRFELTERDFSYYDGAIGDWRAEPGEYTVVIGTSSEDAVLSRTVTIEGRPAAPSVDELTTLGELLSFPPTAEFIGGLLKGYSDGEESDAIGARMKRAMLYNAPLRLVKGIAKMSDERYGAFVKKLKDIADEAKNKEVK